MIEKRLFNIILDLHLFGQCFIEDLQQKLFLTISYS